MTGRQTVSQAGTLTGWESDSQANKYTDRRTVKLWTGLDRTVGLTVSQAARQTGGQESRQADRQQ